VADRERTALSVLQGTVTGVEDFETVYKAEFPRLIRYLQNQGARLDEARDAAQGAFTTAYTRWRSIRNPRAYLRKVAWREFLRSAVVPENPTDTTVESVEQASPVNWIELSEEARTVQAALTSLPVKQRQVMALFIDGFSPTEIAEQLGCESGAVRQNLFKARRKLKTLLDDKRRAGE
jgi:RNA polymerase sigma factor (sigma-70 family)